MTALRFSDISPLDVPPPIAARRLGLSLPAFLEALDGLLQRGFPPADPTTGNYDIEAVDAWRRKRHGFEGGGSVAKNASDGFAEKLARL